MATPVSARPPDASQSLPDNKSSDLQTFVDANELLMFVANNGSFAHDRSALFFSGSGLHYPRLLQRKVMYAGGLWVAARLGKGTRASAAAYDFDFAPGPMANGSFLPDQPSFRVYKINRGDNRDSNPDYRDWPFADGAPALRNSSGNDSLDSDGNRIPRLRGNQTLWTVFNDTDPALRESLPGSPGTKFLSLEIQLSAWSYGGPGDFARTAFLEYTIINKSDSTIRELYCGLWADPDVGDYRDDLVGCDTILNLGFAYNSGPDLVYGDDPPSVGYLLLSGLTDHTTALTGVTNPMTTFGMWGNSGSPGFARETWDVLRGLTNNGDPHFVPGNSTTTRYMVSGDPVTGTGWRDTNPTDRRFLVGTGPITMPPGDTQQVTAAVIVGQGDTPTTSVADLKASAATVHALFARGFDTPLSVRIDILPRLCPNTLLWEPRAIRLPSPSAVDDGSIVPLAVIATPDFDLSAIDKTTLRLHGVAPISAALTDVAELSYEEMRDCDCMETGHDGVPDLFLRFDRDELLTALEPFAHGDTRSLTLSGQLLDGQPFAGRDCVTLQRYREIDPVPGRGRGESPITLHGGAPNPFNAGTVISFDLERGTQIRLEVFDILGRRVRTLIHDDLPEGEHTIPWDGRDDRAYPVASGVYFVRLQAAKAVAVRQIILMK